MKKLFIILVLAAGHFILSLVALFMTLGASMSRFDTGGSPSASETVIAVVAAVLHFPLVLLVQALSPIRFSSSWAEYIPFVLNSLLWGASIYYFVAYIKRKLGKRAG
jgi:predicted neutral ceramidase superfamily lipid hydrolase